MAGRWRGVIKVARDDPAAFLAVWLVTDVAAQFVLAVLPDAAVLGGPSLGLVIALAGWVISLVLWIRTRGPGPATGLLRAFLVALLLLWAFVTVLGNVRGESAGINSLMAPVLLLMLLAKPPTGTRAVRAADAFAWALVVAALVSLVLEVAHVIPSWYEVGVDWDALRLADYRAPLQAIALESGEKANYWVPLASLLGLDGRWAGAFVHPNIAGPVGVFLLVFGVTRTRARRVFFGGTGALMLVLTSSRSSWGAALAGLGVAAAVWWLRRPSRLSAGWRAVIVALPAMGFVVVAVALNPGLTGRSEVWPVFADLWRQAPFLGVGNQGISDAIAAGDLPMWATHAHNVPFDALVRYGVLGFALVVIVLGIATALGIAAARSGRGAAGIAIVTALVVGGLADTTIQWGFWVNTTYALILAALISASLPQRPASDPTPVP